MNGRFLLDTNIVIAIFAKDSGVMGRIGQAAEVFVPSIVLGELFYGARKSHQAPTNLARIEEFASETAVLACDAATRRRGGNTGELRTTCESSGDQSRRMIFGLLRLPCSMA